MKAEQPGDKPWKNLLTPEQRPFFETIESDLNQPDGSVTHLDRQGRRIKFADWVEAHADRDYANVATTKIDGIIVWTTWIGVEIDDPSWGRVIFGTQLIDTRAQTLARLAQEARHKSQVSDGAEPFNVLSVIHPPEGELIHRTSHLDLAIAEAAHPAFVLALKGGAIDPDLPSMLWPMADLIRALPGRGEADYD